MIEQPHLLGVGVYGLSEAARLVSVNADTVRRWTADGGRRVRAHRLAGDDLPVQRDRRAISFLELIELLVVARLRDQGVSLQTIRKVHAKMQGTWEMDHPFAHQRLRTDGRTVFLDALDDLSDPRLEEVLTDQRTMPEILLPCLARVEYSQPTRMAERWHIAPGVVIDPERSFGRPIVATDGISTHVLARAYRANAEDAALVADLYDVSIDAVHHAVTFENSLRSPQAA